MTAKYIGIIIGFLPIKKVIFGYSDISECFIIGLIGFKICTFGVLQLIFDILVNYR